ncbi:MAG TPA: folylpolyglutamate synthase/dihydrofolate synthase family protein [Methylomirabilota bacterium]|nr:folylpolyglutamate synthase/dihydrofolate synthase family protein [Methylomirabilota bacterium]
MNYKEAIDFLYSLRLFGTKLGLEKTFRLAALAGNPQQKLKFIHVAGTNGKGSTCAMLESIYRTAGYRTGLFTSPHLVRFSERIQVNRQLITDADVIRLVEQFREFLPEFPKDAQPTFFEVTTAMSLVYFAEQRCDLVIWETGLGGRLDATNIVTPLASVITNIQFDHEKWLGNSLAEIASEKAGIIKPSIPVITGADAPEALAVIRKVAQANGSRITEVSGGEGVPPLPLLGEHQKKNAAVALATVNVLQTSLPVSPDAIAEGLKNVHWPGRLQLARLSDGRQVLLDGAHNLDGVKTLAHTLTHTFPAGPKTLILGMLADKQWEQMCAMLAPFAETIYTCPVSSERSADAAALAKACAAANPVATVVPCSALAEALERANDSAFTVISGSLHFIGEAMERLEISPAAPSNERGLNEWQATPR